MLGRYVAGTLLVLGVAMLIAPERQDTSDAVVVTRAETAPSALDTAHRPHVTKPAASLLDPPTTHPRAEAAATDAVEAAVMEAMALDASELTGNPTNTADATDIMDELPEEVADQGGVVLAGLADPGFFATGSGNQEAAAQDNSKLLYVTGNRVNLRSGPSTAYSVVGSVAMGDLVELIAYEGSDWARIRLNDGDQMGYMSRRYLARSLEDG